MDFERSQLYRRLAATGPGHYLQNKFGPPPLRRYRAGRPLVDDPVVIAAAPGGTLAASATELLADAPMQLLSAPPTDTAIGGLIFDASGIKAIADLNYLYENLAPLITRIAPCGRVIVLARTPELYNNGNHSVRIVQRALEGFVRALAKELRNGGTAQLVYIEPGGEPAIASTLRFLLSARSAYVDGQVIRLGTCDISTPTDWERDWERPLAGDVALVTGAARGIGEQMARTLARAGAAVICADLAAAGDALAAVANAVGGTSLVLDVAAQGAGQRLVDYIKDRHGRLDIAVLNAGITRDRTLARMSHEQWQSVIDVNLGSQQRLIDSLLAADVLGSGGRVITVASIAGIAGNRGQTNYATSKAGVIGIVDAYAADFKARGATINAVAPGFIETAMTSSIPFVIREVGRRMNSLGQAGLPIDVAETVAWLAEPGSGTINGNVVRVCGQSLLGA